MQDDAQQAHGALVSVRGVGILLVGPSGIGKSECALDLVARGHALVADDVVRFRLHEGRLYGSAPEVIRHYMEIRGLGLLYLPDLYGAQAVRDEAQIDLVCRLETWRPGLDLDRIGLERPTECRAGVALPVIRLPARPAGSMATLVEVAARDHEQRRRGRAGARRFDEQWRREQRRS